MNRKERGFTLIELLATITILSIVGVVIWSVFFQGFQYSQKSMSKNRMQQEANIILTHIIKIHQTSPQYEIINENCEITIKYLDTDHLFQNHEISHPQLCFKTNFSGTINPNSEDKKLIVNVSALHNQSNTFSMETTLYKLKGGVIK